jgi:hypothetical protein
VIRSLKVLSLGISVALALGAIGASVAGAVEFHSEIERTKYFASGDGNQVFVSPAGTTTCTGLTFEATTTTKTNAGLTATSVIYTGSGASGHCIEKTIFGNIEVAVDFVTDECDLVFHANGELDIECKKPGGVTISGPGCSTTLLAQTGLKTPAYDNKEAGTKRDLTITMVVSGIRGTASGFLCSKEGEFTTGQYSGNITVRGFEDKVGGAQIGIWAE